MAGSSERAAHAARPATDDRASRTAETCSGCCRRSLERRVPERPLHRARSASAARLTGRRRRDARRQKENRPVATTLSVVASVAALLLLALFVVVSALVLAEFGLVVLAQKVFVLFSQKRVC